MLVEFMTLGLVSVGRILRTMLKTRAAARVEQEQLAIA